MFLNVCSHGTKDTIFFPQSSHSTGDFAVSSLFGLDGLEPEGVDGGVGSGSQSKGLILAPKPLAAILCALEFVHEKWTTLACHRFCIQSVAREGEKGFQSRKVALHNNGYFLSAILLYLNIVATPRP